MSITRRSLVRGSAAALALPAIARHALAEEPIRIGWLATFTGPLSSPTIGFDRGVKYAVEQINGKGGVNGRMLEVISRDTQGDPTKAVNATQDVISRQKVHAVFGPVNSGELLATTPIMARAKVPSLVAGVVNSLIDPVKFPNAFRVTPSNAQWDGAVRAYCKSILKAKKVAIMADATGYGTSAHDDSMASFRADGFDIVYDGVIDPAQPDVTPDLLRAKGAGAEVIVSWTVSAGMAARMMNARAALEWDVPIAGHPALGTGEIGKLVSKPAYWEKVYQVGYRSCSYGADGKLPKPNQDFVDSVRGKFPLADTSLWWIASGVDAINLIAEAVAKTGSSDSEKIIGHWNTLNMWPGLYGHYSFSPTDHNGFLGTDVVMSKANSQRDGAFDLAPGYALMLAAILAAGLAVGATYALIGVTYNIMFSASRVMSFTAGQLGMLGGVFGALAISRLGIPILPGMVLALAGCAVVGLVTEMIAVRPVLKALDQHLYVLSTLGFALMIQTFTAIEWSTEPQPFPRLIGIGAGGPWDEKFWLPVVACAATIIGLELLYRRTLVGRAFLAIAEDNFAARALGLPERNLRMASFALAGAVGGLAGFAGGELLLAFFANGAMLNFLGFVPVALGGLGNNRGAVIGGLALGVFQQAANFLMGGVFAGVAVFAVFIVVLLVAPQGLFGAPVERRV